MRIHALLITILLVVLSPAAGARTWRVPGDSPNIRTAILNAADGDTVLVADGIWTGTNNRDIEFLGKAITVRSENGPDNCIIDCEGMGRGALFNSSEGPGSRFSGFTIRHGVGQFGGGIVCVGASPIIEGNVITSCSSSQWGGAIYCQDSSAHIIGNTLTWNYAESAGGGIGSFNATPLVDGCTIADNQSLEGGGIAVFGDSQAVIRGSELLDNTAYTDGGGLHCAGQSGTWLFNNRIRRNMSGSFGGGIYCGASAQLYVLEGFVEQNSAERGGGIYAESGPTLTLYGPVVRYNDADTCGGGIGLSQASATCSLCLIYGNSSIDGGGIYCISNSYISLGLCTVADNSAESSGGGIYISFSELVCDSGIVWGNAAAYNPSIRFGGPTDPVISYSDIQGGWPGTGNIDQGPRFTVGPRGPFALGQTAAGQAADSPCLDAGNPGTAAFLSTRSDVVEDHGRLDMGYHFPSTGLAAGPGPAYANPPRVRVYPPYQGADLVYDFTPYGAPHYGVNLAAGRVVPDREEIIVTGAGPGAVFGPHVRGFYWDGTPVAGLSFFAYGTLRYGVNVTTGDLDGDGWDEIVTGAGPGAVFGPHVRAFGYDAGTVSPVPGVSYFAYGTLKYGVNVAAGDLDGDGRDEIVTGAGPGTVFGPHVRAWNVDGGTAAAIPGISFFAYGTLRWGVNVAAGDIDGDGMAEIVTAPGPSSPFGAQVRGWNFDGSVLRPMNDCNFFAWNPSQGRYGARVSARSDLDRDGRAEIVVGGGPDPEVSTLIRVFSYGDGTVSQSFNVQAFPASMHGGANAVAGYFNNY